MKNTLNFNIKLQGQKHKYKGQESVFVVPFDPMYDMITSENSSKGAEIILNKVW